MSETATVESEPTIICERMRKLALKLKGSYMNSDGSAVDYKSLMSGENKDFVELEELLTKQMAEKGVVEKLYGVNNTTESESDQDIETLWQMRKAFFINLYNVLMIYGVLKEKMRIQSEKQQNQKTDTSPGTTGGKGVGNTNSNIDDWIQNNNVLKHPIQQARDDQKVCDFFMVTKTILGGESLSLDEIEHGILRGNRPGAGKSIPLFDTNSNSEPSDIRHSWIFPPSQIDPRIHFALVCGAKGCPPIQVYTTKNMERGLKQATMNYLKSEVEVFEDASNDDSSSNVNDIILIIKTSKLFEWYGVDFNGGSVSGIVRWIRDNGGEELKGKIGRSDDELETMEKENRLKLEFKPYDWSLNSV